MVICDLWEPFRERKSQWQPTALLSLHKTAPATVLFGVQHPGVYAAIALKAGAPASEKIAVHWGLG